MKNATMMTIVTGLFLSLFVVGSSVAQSAYSGMTIVISEKDSVLSYQGQWTVVGIILPKGKRVRIPFADIKKEPKEALKKIKKILAQCKVTIYYDKVGDVVRIESIDEWYFPLTQSQTASLEAMRK
jgi:hypothetical protein